MIAGNGVRVPGVRQSSGRRPDYGGPPADGGGRGGHAGRDVTGHRHRLTTQVIEIPCFTFQYSTIMMIDDLLYNWYSTLHFNAAIKSAYKAGTIGRFPL